ncbi:hypothetical protein D3C84_1114600 [compost metagenome]
MKLNSATAMDTRMIAAGIAAMAHFTMNRTIDRKLMRKSTMTTACGAPSGAAIGKSFPPNSARAEARALA